VATRIDTYDQFVSPDWDPLIYEKLYIPQQEDGKILIDKININKTDSILDIGSGTGNLTFELAKRAINGRVLGIDLSKNMIEYSKNSAEYSTLKNIDFIQCNLLEIDFESTFNVIFSNYVLHWIEDLEKALRLIYQALAANGTVGLQISSKGCFSLDAQSASRVVDKLSLNNEFENYLWPCHYPEKSDVEQIMNKIGYREIRTEEYSKDYYFINPEFAINFHLRGGFQSLLSKVPDHLKTLFLEELFNEFCKRRTEKGILTNIKGLYIFANK